MAEKKLVVLNFSIPEVKNGECEFLYNGEYIKKICRDQIDVETLVNLEQKWLKKK